MPFRPPTTGDVIQFTELDGATVITASETIASNDSDVALPTSAAVIDFAITGTLGATDNVLLRANGTGGKTAQGSGILVDDSDNVTLPDGAGISLQEAITFTSTTSGINQIVFPDNIDGDALAFKDSGGGGTLMRFKTANGFEEITFYSNSKFDSAASLVIGGNIGFFNTAAQSKQTVTGAKGSNAALASLLTALSTYGLITDSSSA